MSRLGMRHPSGEQLLHFADGEMTSPQSEEIRGHLKACWECRNELEEIEQTVGACVRYRKVVLEACLPAPPKPWFDIYPRLAEIDDIEQRRRWMNRLLAALTGAWNGPRRWVPAVAMIVLIAVVVQQLRDAPSVQAAELLRKAAVAAESKPRKQRRIRIRAGSLQMTRIVGIAGRPVMRASDSPTELESLFREAHYSWDDPLSAKSYSDWRDQLISKQDEVTRAADHFQLRTSTGSGVLVEATLKLSSADFHPVEGTLQFRNHELVEISELPDAELLEPLRPMLPRRRAQSEVRVPMEMATPGEELAVFAALHRAGADLGDPVEVKRSGGEIQVTGTGISPERQQAIQEELRSLPRVAVRLSSEPAEGAGLEERSPRRISVSPGNGPLQMEMEQRLGGRAVFEQFADEVLDTTEAFMSRAHALRRLARRFPPDVESELTDTEKQILGRMRREHAEVLVGSVRQAESRVCAAAGITAQNGHTWSGWGAWQDQAEQLFLDARHAESMVVALLGLQPEQTQSPELPAMTTTSLAQLRARSENYLSQAAER